jgi:hypothetical protein
MAAPGIAASPEWRTAVQGKRPLSGFKRCIGKEDRSALSCDRRSSTAARSLTGSALTRFPSATPRRQKTVLVQFIGLDVVTQWGVLSGLCSEDSLPNFGHSFALDTKFADLELALSNPMHQLNAADRNSCTSKPL